MTTATRTEPARAVRWDAPPASAADVLTRARHAIPLLRDAASRIEERRRLPDDIVDVLRQVGAWRAVMPTEWGGPELTSPEQAQLLELLAQGDASAAWCAMIGMDSGIYAGYLDDGVARELYQDLDTITAGALFPTGKAEKVTGGYVISGQWRFASCVHHCQVLMASCLVHEDGVPVPDPLTGQPRQWRVFAARPGQFEIHDTWYTTGLAGSGSNDYSCQDLFVPAEHAFALTRPRRPGPLLRTPDAVQRKMPGIPLGLARAALDHAVDLAEGRADRETGTPWTSDFRVHEAIGRSQMELNAARASVYESLSLQWEVLCGDREDLRKERIDAALARTFAFQTARRVVQRLYDLVGGAAVYRRTSPFDRWLRDVNTMCQHAVAQDAVLQMAGVVALGGEPPNPVNPALAVSLPAVREPQS
ncbi:alkylation response protein AidB-like acyl-CoA dehydrogenase [Streptomyces griseochromogenes]|uniref:Acyl-CoA dehydrogenase n=1 Tax=Streptomyces griseochromogenes TaxID=68214 RepID=A0A1B1B2U8_9ACTN|nr:acyl-CoA dehydrogenase family protein [Streptomyces griseochromogenes]ANP53146.1 acyl-CoA dehydrogenase [Streptomyces griseochromogenes]MBP2053832.1 alkylation response protein AidB-like acyl-CoA dehydrogenase [Streptomyces griseochromogenes]